MKKIALLMMCVATMAFASCSSLSTAASSNTAASASGASCGKALVALYNSYKATGKLDLTNGNNLANALTIVTAYTQLKENHDNETYKSAFRSGMITSGKPYISQSNANNLMSGLLASSGLANVNASNIAQKAETVTAIITLLNAIK